MADLSNVPDLVWLILVISILALVYIFVTKKTGSTATNMKGLFSILLVASFIGVIFYGGFLNDGQLATIPGDGIEIDTDYTTLFVIDSTTAVISGDFSQTDEADSTSVTIDKDTRSMTVTNKCSYVDNACTWDAFSFTVTITREDDSRWVDGAKVTSSVSASIDAGILDWGIASNNTGGNPIITMVDKDPLGKSGLIWVDGAAANKALGATTVGSLNEYSSGESTTSTGLYFALNEDQLARNVPAGIFGNTWRATFSDDFGWSESWTVSITITTQAATL